MDTSMENGAPLRTTRGRSRIISATPTRARARKSGGPIQQYILELVTENPEMPYDVIADEVKAKYTYARTSEKSVASTIYRAGMAQ